MAITYTRERAAGELFVDLSAAIANANGDYFKYSKAHTLLSLYLNFWPLRNDATGMKLVRGRADATSTAFNYLIVPNLDQDANWSIFITTAKTVKKIRTPRAHDSNLCSRCGSWVRKALCGVWKSIARIHPQKQSQLAYPSSWTISIWQRYIWGVILVQIPVYGCSSLKNHRWEAVLHQYESANVG